ncbi:MULTISPECIES: 2-hydroxyacid dehydrogenase [unclassified Arenibacter]|uniref:2-hydroxyacid dehydrogenase n=1 Tax=unclassified Arenibacter TaxID=2615047 RepID=UPI000E344377|nr:MULTISPECIES: 2-hydroxyacid dehydrogenase [unclassified Arenibacter]MCM4163440.1 hydroxyacid dehydrogenase [Arenibacter sp. A80]RFT57438.1 2-hydroxyacid dehydrogenase [Arenibacter sp. P308M17]
MKLLVYSAKDFEIPFLDNANNDRHKVSYTKDALNSETAIQALGHKAVSIFSGDDASSLVLEKLSDMGVRYISLRSAGYNNVHLKTAHKYGLKVANVPYYSPYSIAEHAIALLQALNRKIVLADRQVHSYNFLQNNLMGFDLNQKTVGIIGTGNIGSVMAKIMHGFGCKILANDLKPDFGLVQLYDLSYTSLDQLCEQSDIISLHIPLTQESHYLIDKQKLSLMKPEVVLINTARGALVETKELISALEKKAIGGYCTDVYEKEIGSFFTDNSTEGIKDMQLIKLLSFPNVLLTPHQGFITKEALTNIAMVTFENLNSWKEGKPSRNELDV